MVQKIKHGKEEGKRIRDIRILNSMTQEHVISKLQLHGLNITRSIYSQIETGRYNIEIPIFCALCNLYQVDADSMLDIQNHHIYRISNFFSGNVSSLVNMSQSLKHYRSKACMTQIQLLNGLSSFNIMMSQNYYSDIENGKKNIKINLLAALCDIYDISYNDFFTFYSHDNF